MDAPPIQLDGQLGADGPHSPFSGCVSGFHQVPDQQMLLDRIEEERRMKSVDRFLNVLLLGVGATVYINYFAAMQSSSRLYPSRTMLVAGLNEVSHTVSNGTFTSGTFLMIFGAPSFTFWALQSIMDACLFVPHLIIVAVIFGKWVLGHFGASSGEDRHEQTRRRPLHDWPKHARARILSSLYALPVLFALSQSLYFLCWLTARRPFMGICIVLVSCVFYWSMGLYYHRLMASHF